MSFLFVNIYFVSNVEAVPISVNYADRDGEGFLDPFRGEVRRGAFEFSVEKWSRVLGGSVPIAITASMPHRGGTGASALLASAGAVTVHRNFGGIPDTWYAAALANQVAGVDLNGEGIAEISILFNADVDEPDVLGSISWYYGTDASSAFDIDLVTVALHEIGHGLGFFELVDVSSGQWLSPGGPGIFDRMLFRPRVGPLDQMRVGERLAAVVSPPLLWVGPAAATFNGESPAMFTPEPPIPGTSVAHWDPQSNPVELMAPTSDRPTHDLGLLLPALQDLGWQLSVPSPTPRMPSATPTASVTPTESRIPVTPAPADDFIYVANFDDNTITVLSSSPPLGVREVTTIAVGDGPTRVAASPDGRRVYVTHFRDGTMSGISTRRNSVISTVPVGVSPNDVAISSDGKTAVVSDTFSDEAVIIDIAAQRVRTRIAAGAAPGAIAIAPDGLMFVVSYGQAKITVIEAQTDLRRAIIPTSQSNLVSVAFADSGTGYAVAPVASNLATQISNDLLIASEELLAVNGEPQAVEIQRDGSEIYVASSSADAARHQVTVFDSRRRSVGSIGTGLFPNSMALSSDGARLFVTNTGANAVSIVDTRRRRSEGSVEVGMSPMGLTIAAVPRICDGDCEGDQIVAVDELIRAVSIATGDFPIAVCDAADHDDDGQITVDEVILATASALEGCSDHSD